MSLFDDHITAQATRLLEDARQARLTIATAESCTGGLIAACLTDVAGSSDVVEAGLVTYSNSAKTALLGVSADLIRDKGAVSKEVALAMVSGALEHTTADLTVAVTGIAGPGGGSEDKPVGLVHFAAQRRGSAPVHQKVVFADHGRSYIRIETLKTALNMLAALI